MKTRIIVCLLCCAVLVSGVVVSGEHDNITLSQGNEVSLNTLILSAPAKDVGTLFFKDGKFQFDGNATLATQEFIKHVNKEWISAQSTGCVRLSEAIEAWELSLGLIKFDEPFSNTLTLECGPCKCLSWRDYDGIAECYSYLAEQDRKRRDDRERSWKVLQRVKEHGICVGP